MDLSKVLAVNLAEQTHRVGIEFDGAGEATVGFIIVGEDSPQYRAEDDRQRVEVTRERAALNGRKVDTKSEEFQDKLQNRYQSLSTRRAVAITVGWFGFKDGKKDAPFDATKLEPMYDKFRTWRDLVLAEAVRPTNFLPK